MSGFFISFEGGEGAGKTTQIKAVEEFLTEKGYSVVVTREPGGTYGAELVRSVILSGGAEQYGTAMEAILFAAARNDHVEGLIRPALEQGKVVLCDRYIDSSRVYQGVTGQIEPDFMDNLERITIDGIKPDLTLILDIPAEAGLARANLRRGNEIVDRFEKETLSVHEQRRQAFLRLAEEESERCKVVNAAQNIDGVSKDILAHIDVLLASHSPKGA